MRGSIQSSNIPLQLQEYNTKLVTVDNIQLALYGSKSIADASGVQHSNVKRIIKRLIKTSAICKISHLTSEAPNLLPWYKDSTYISRGKTLHQYLINHKSLDLFIQMQNGARGIQARTAFMKFTSHALQVANQIDYETTALYIETRDETKALARELNECVSNVHGLATEQGTRSTVAVFEMSYNKCIKSLIVGNKVKGSWRDHTDKIELPLLHTMLRTGIATINHHLDHGRPYKEIYRSFKEALIEVMEVEGQV